MFSSKPKHPQLLFNKTPVAYSSSQKHFGIILDEKLSFANHIKLKIQKAGIGINVIRSLYNIRPQQALLTIYPIYQSIQYKKALAIKSAILYKSQAKLYKALDLETLKFRRRCRKRCLLFKVITSGLPLYLSKYIPYRNHSCNTRLNEGGLKTYPCRTDVFKY